MVAGNAGAEVDVELGPRVVMLWAFAPLVMALGYFAPLVVGQDGYYLSLDYFYVKDNAKYPLVYELLKVAYLQNVLRGA